MPRLWALILSHAWLRLPLFALEGSSLLLPSERLVISITARRLLAGLCPPDAPGADPRSQSVSHHGLGGGALRSRLVGLAGLERHRWMEKQDSDGGPATRRCLQVSSVQRDPGREGPGTLPAGASRAGSRRPSPAGGEGADGGPATQRCGLSWTPGPGTSTEEVAAWWAQCSWALGAGGSGSEPGQPARGVGGGGLEPGAWSRGGREAACACVCACVCVGDDAVGPW